jgi:hypothetical protein
VARKAYPKVWTRDAKGMNDMMSVRRHPITSCRSACPHYNHTIITGKRCHCHPGVADERDDSPEPSGPNHTTTLPFPADSTMSSRKS